jgi:hypothetical protein
LISIYIKCFKSLERERMMIGDEKRRCNMDGKEK